METLEYEGHTTPIRTKGWWCSSCGDGILDANALKASERAFLELQAKVACLASWGSNLPDDATMLGVQHDLDRLGATCRVCVKNAPRGQWEPVFERIATFKAALDTVPGLLVNAIEVGVFLDHTKYGGIFIWTSIHPDTANRFEHYQ